MTARPCLRAALLLLAACRADAPATEAATIELALAGQPGQHRLEARGLPPLSEPEGGWSELLCLSVASARRADGPAVPAVVGRYALTAGVLTFEPRYALQPELEYTAVLRKALLPGAKGDELDLIETLVVRRTEAAVAPVVAAVYPTARPLPANVLKFYVHFSRPMARGFAYERAHVLVASGERVERPFLELGEELWNPDGTRLTLIVDPGRIKRGLLLHEQMGPVLEADRSYTLLVEAGWPGADGAALATDLRVDFTTSAADVMQPDPRRWQLELPRASTLDPLVVTLDEPLDHALLQRMIRVVGTEGRALDGDVAVGPRETRWSFVPRQPWGAGEHALLVDAELEDLAGNSVGRPFETRLTETAPAPDTAPARVLFQPRP